jgi:hypothetical protein
VPGRCQAVRAQVPGDTGTGARRYRHRCHVEPGKGQGTPTVVKCGDSKGGEIVKTREADGDRQTDGDSRERVKRERAWSEIREQNRSSCRPVGPLSR